MYLRHSIQCPPPPPPNANAMYIIVPAQIS